MDPGAPVREPYRAARSGERWRTAPVERPEAKQIPAELQDREGATLAWTTRVERRSRRRAVGSIGFGGAIVLFSLFGLKPPN